MPNATDIYVKALIMRTEILICHRLVFTKLIAMIISVKIEISRNQNSKTYIR